MSFEVRLVKQSCFRNIQSLGLVTDYRNRDFKIGK